MLNPTSIGDAYSELDLSGGAASAFVDEPEDDDPREQGKAAPPRRIQEPVKAVKQHDLRGDAHTPAISLPAPRRARAAPQPQQQPQRSVAASAAADVTAPLGKVLFYAGIVLTALATHGALQERLNKYVSTAYMSANSELLTRLCYAAAALVATLAAKRYLV